VEMSEALDFTIQDMETAKAYLKKLFNYVSAEVTKDEMCYRIQEVISMLDA
jgi:adenylate cyclase class IV